MQHDTTGVASEGAEVYRRRRLLVFGGLIAFVALVAWGCQGSGRHKPSSPAAAFPAAAAGQPAVPPASGTAVAIPAAVPNTASPNTASSMASPGTASPSPSASASPSAQPSGPPGQCRPGDLVLTFSEPTNSYRGGQQPSFSITLVNTAATSCAMPADPHALPLVITTGKQRVFASTDCPPPGHAKPLQLRRGVPVTVQVTWNRRLAEHGCPAGSTRSGQAEMARPGTYVATVKGAGQSKSLVFTLA